MQMLPIETPKSGAVFTLRPYQAEAVRVGVDFFNRKSGVDELIMSPTGCHAKGTEILMADFSVKRVEDVVVGDKLKCPTTWGEKEVLRLCRGREMMYELLIEGVNHPAYMGSHHIGSTKRHVVNGGHMLYLFMSTGEDEGDNVSVSVNEFMQWSEREKQSARACGMFDKDFGVLFKFHISPLEEDDFYGFTLDGDHLYMTSDFIIHHNSGKSLIISGICEGVEGRMLVLQPSQEILKQNYAKFTATGTPAGIYSASVGRKDMARVTFASIQTVMSKSRDGRYLNAELFLGYRNIIIDECHLGSDPKGEGQLVTLLSMIKERIGAKPRVLGLTATPFRTSPITNRFGEKDIVLKMLTRTRPRIFGHISYWTQVKELLEQGFLATPRYFDVRKELSHGFDRSALKVNSTGADYDNDALQEYYDTIDFKQDIVKIVRRINKTGRQVLVFMSSVSDAEWVSNELGNSATVTGKTPKAERDKAEADFKAGKLRSVVNCGVWTTGFDYPELKVVLLARPLRSLSLYYQMLGRALRPFEGKEAWLVDACGNFPVFGRIEDLTLDHDDKNLPVLKGSGGKLLTGVPLKEQEVHVADGDMKAMVSKKPVQTKMPFQATVSRGGFNEMMQKARAHAGVAV